jgi:hypothetical protein
MKFKYRFYEGCFLPMVPVKLFGKENRLVEVKAYIDTGASYSLFHSEVAKILGLDLEKGRKHELVVGDGDSLKV